MRCRLRRCFATVATRRRGLAAYAVPTLRSPEDCARLAREASHASEALVGRIVAGPPSAASLAALDALSATLCGVLDPLELARHTHPDAAFVSAADEAHSELSQRMAEYSSDERLYDAVRAVLEEPRLVATLSAEQHLSLIHI